LDLKEIVMATTFQKRQKEMKRLEKARDKAERRAQKKLIKGTPGGPPIEALEPMDNEGLDVDFAIPVVAEPRD
jgi:hypothetical protein